MRSEYKNNSELNFAAFRSSVQNLIFICFCIPSHTSWYSTRVILNHNSTFERDPHWKEMIIELGSPSISKIPNCMGCSSRQTPNKTSPKVITEDMSTVPQPFITNLIEVHQEFLAEGGGRWKASKLKSLFGIPSQLPQSNTVSQK